METSKTIVRAVALSAICSLYLSLWKLWARAGREGVGCAVWRPSDSPLYEYNYLLMVLTRALIRFPWCFIARARAPALALPRPFARRRPLFLPACAAALQLMFYTLLLFCGEGGVVVGSRDRGGLARVRGFRVCYNCLMRASKGALFCAREFSSSLSR